MTDDFTKPANTHVVAVIGARGGSKGLPRKNIRELLGKPLIVWSIEDALACELIDRVIVSTDDEEIASVAKAAGAEVPFMRPAELAGDAVPSVAFLQHALAWLEEEDGYPVDVVVYLQPTDVFRKRWMLDEVIIRLLRNPDLDSVFVGCPTHKNYWVEENGQYRRVAYQGELPRQQKQPLVREDTGIASAVRADLVRSGRRVGDRVDIVLNDDFFAAVDIHDEEDLWLAETIMKRLKDSDYTRDRSENDL